MKIILLISFLAFLSRTSFSQVLINEICPLNSTIISDEDGEFSDWIELYNNSSSTMNLLGYSISDDLNDPYKWAFPGISILPNSFITVFASGKDKTEIIDHWESVVLANGVWKYIIPSSHVDSLWNTVGFNDSGWLTGTGGIGYGDGDDATVLSPPVTSVFIRQEFNIVDTSLLAGASLNIDFDDGFVAYVNGNEIARANVGVTYTPTHFDELAYNEHEAQLYQGQPITEWLYNEQDVKTVITNGTNVLAIQVHNVDSFSSDLSIIPFLSFGIKDTSHHYNTPPAFIQTGVSLLHTNFKLSNSGETVYLSNSVGNLIDSVSYTEIGIDNSLGKFLDGQANIVYFDIPTPNSSNNSSNTFTGYNSAPVIILNPGFYTGIQATSITTTSSGATTRYTVDGSEPVPASGIAGIVTIDSTMVVRARSFGAGKLPSAIETNSFFIDYTSKLSVVSICTNPDNFWDWNTGIYVMGPNADTVVPYFNANFWQDWERPVHIEFFENTDSIGFEQDFGIKIHGGWSRSNKLKSLRILAKGKYGNSSLNYKLFPDKEIYDFKSFILRNSGNETNVTHFRDALMHKAVQKKHILTFRIINPQLCL
ncbi:MAG: lamin tail domain-containing protein [Bacteroidota bacterium]